MLRALVIVTLAPLTALAAASAVAAAPVIAPATQYRMLPAARIAAVADEVVHRIVPDDAHRTVVPAFAIVGQQIPVGKVTITPATPQVSPTYIAIPLQIDVDGQIARTLVAGFRVQQYVRTVVAARDLLPGTVLREDDLALARVPANGRAPVEIGELIGRKVNLETPRGAQIHVEQTSVVQLVKPGSGVVLTIRDGPVALNADVLARTGGGLGDSVTVYNPQTRTVLSGTVTGPNLVELVLTGDPS